MTQSPNNLPQDSELDMAYTDGYLGYKSQDYIAGSPEHIAGLKKVAELVQRKICQHQAEPTGWQPIETAPMDDTNVLLGYVDRPDMRPGIGFYHNGWKPYRISLPSHWMPLPQPPKE